MDTKFSLEYLSDEFFMHVKFAMEYAKSKGFIFLLYDEGGWPSGSACGRVVEKYPEYAAKKISKCFIEEISDINGEVIAVYDENYNRVTDISDGKYLYYKENLKTIVPHLLEEKAIEEFMNITHKRYGYYMKETFGNSALAMFTDEAILYYPYYIGDVSDFEKQSGYSFYKYIPALFEDVMGEEGRKFKVEYIEYCMKLFSEKYIKKCMNGRRTTGCFSQGIWTVIICLKHIRSR